MILIKDNTYIHRSGQEEFLYLHLTNSVNGQRPHKMQTYKMRGENQRMKEFQEETVGPWRQLTLFPYEITGMPVITDNFPMLSDSE